MMKPGKSTPAIQGSKYTKSSCSPRKYHGALEGLGVRAVAAGSSIGAAITIDHTINATVNSTRQMNSV
jgi:hypothetical protein